VRLPGDKPGRAGVARMAGEVARWSFHVGCGGKR
jgi:hypothetical protein